MFKKHILCLVVCCCLSQLSMAADREVAITIDDLPFVGSCNNDPNKLRREKERFLKILQTLVDKQVPATGFVIAGSIEKDQWQLLEQFRDAGFILGNHTFSHPSLNQITAEKYISNVDRADKKLAPLFTSQKYFRYPYLAESKGEKKQQVYSYLADHQYTIAPVTIDSKDFIFNSQLFAIPWRLRNQNLNQLKHRYLNYIWKQTLLAEKRVKKLQGKPAKQILLIHANLLNSLFLGDIIDLYQKNGYRIISLAEALESTAPTLNNISTKPENQSEMIQNEAEINKL